MLKVTKLKEEGKKPKGIHGWCEIKKLEREENSDILLECLKARSYHILCYGWRKQ